MPPDGALEQLTGDEPGAVKQIIEVIRMEKRDDFRKQHDALLQAKYAATYIDGACGGFPPVPPLPTTK